MLCVFLVCYSLIYGGRTGNTREKGRKEMNTDVRTYSDSELRKQYAITRARHIKWLHRAIAVEDLCEDFCDTFGFECDASVLDYIAAHVRDTDNTPNKLLGCIICGGYTVKPEYKELLERVIEDRETKVITAMLIREILDKDEVQGNEKTT